MEEGASEQVTFYGIFSFKSGGSCVMHRGMWITPACKRGKGKKGWRRRRKRRRRSSRGKEVIVSRGCFCEEKK